MKPISDEELLLYYYGESIDPAAIARELEHSAESAHRYQELRSVLDAVSGVEAPEPGPDYGTRLWQQIEPRVAARRRERLWVPRPLHRRLALGAAAMLLLTVGVLIGRFWPRSEEGFPALTAREAIPTVTVAGHLQRTEILLLELVNAETNGETNLEAERDLARELRSANRFFSQTARRAGDLRTAALLDELELLLLEVARASDPADEKELARIRRRLEEGDLLFKVRVVGSRLRQEHPTDPRAATPDRPRRDI